jgi:hypothetical protein
LIFKEVKLCLEETGLDPLEAVAQGGGEVSAVGERVEVEWEEHTPELGPGGIVSAHLVGRRSLIKEELPVMR